MISLRIFKKTKQQNQKNKKKKKKINIFKLTYKKYL